MDIIRLLSDSTANQIAAGEVVQRPASVVKELLENAIDAKATVIQLIIKEAGKLLIQVIDNGTGMSATDARMSFERHATSKIRESSDLYAIKTMGFRGEALASIAAVAQVELRTKKPDEELGTCIKIEGSEIKSQEFVQCTAGTNLQIKNLFFNVPARRNFLKGNPVEMKHIIEEFQRIVLAHPEIEFSLYHNDVEIYNLPITNLSKRITDTLDKSYRDQLAKCDESTSFVSVSGYVGKPSLANKRKGDQFFFVNHRFIKSPYLNHAVLNAFEATIQQGTFPFYVLFLEIDPKHIDINIHPTKTEIKFDDEKTIYAILKSAVKKAIGVYNLTPSIDFESDINYGSLSQVMPAFQPSKQNFERSTSNFESAVNIKTNQENWKKLYDGFDNFVPKNVEQPQIFSSKVNVTEDLKDNLKEVNAIQLHQRYILAQVKSGLLLIDQKNAFERIYYERYLKDINKENGASQQLLFPKTVSLSAIDYAISFEILDLVRNIGFNIEEFGQNTYIINGVPPQFMDEDECEAFKTIITEYRINENKFDRKENLSKTLAKRSAAKMCKTMTNTEISSLINQLFETSMPGISTDGKPTIKIISLEKLGELLLN